MQSSNQIYRLRETAGDNNLFRPAIESSGSSQTLCDSLSQRHMSEWIGRIVDEVDVGAAKCFGDDARPLNERKLIKSGLPIEKLEACMFGS